MSNIRKKYFIIFLTFIINVIIFFFYKYYIKVKLLSLIALKDTLDRNYYYGVFNNFEIAVVVVYLLILLLQIYWNKIINVLNKPILTNKNLIFILFINFCLQTFFILIIKTEPISDSIYYINLAKSLLASYTYKNEFGNLTAFWPSGLPFLMFLIGKVFSNFVLFTKIFIALFNSFSLFFIVKLFSPYLSQKQLNLFLISFILFPNNFFSANAILTDYLFMGLFWIIVYVTIKRTRYFSILLPPLIAFLILLRSTGFVIVIIFFAITWHIQNLKLSIIQTCKLLLLTILFLSPWIYRNYLVFDSLVISSTNGGFNFLMGNHFNSKGYINFDFDYNIKNPNEVAESNIAYSKGINDISKDYINFLKKIPLKILFSYWRADSSLTWTFKSYSGAFNKLIIACIFYFNFIYFLFVISFFMIRLLFIKKQTILFIDKLSLLIYLLFLLLIIVYVGNERYIISLYPIHFYFFVKQIG